ncbi:hypothetical protein BDW74DRAFT_184337 [Aspergillus multicolor]|uniref:uncharacterized protein n=1 Tax=Aspergillus multicolor TaxID=41759 RepID=UPI003CCCC8A2
MSGVEVIGIVSGILTIIDATKRVWDAAHSATHLLAAFREVAARLPLVHDTLTRIKDDRPDKQPDGMKDVIQSCEERAKQLKEIFEKVVPGEHASWSDRYFRAVRALGKGTRVEELMTGILKDLRVLVENYFLRKDWSGATARALQVAIRDVSLVEPSRDDEDQNYGSTMHHYGSGSQYQTHGGRHQHGAGTNTMADNIYNYHGSTFYQNAEARISDMTLLNKISDIDPESNRQDILDDPQGILDECCAWIRDDPVYIGWQEGQKPRVLWVRGDPGQGKTVLLATVCRDLCNAAGSAGEAYVSYFFCHKSDLKFKTAANVLRGIIRLLADKNPRLVKYIAKHHDPADDSLFKGKSEWQALCGVLRDMISDLGPGHVFLAVDGLDECDVDLERLLALVVRDEEPWSGVKWIVSSREVPQVSKNLAGSPPVSTLKLSQKRVKDALRYFIHSKVEKLADRNSYSTALRDEVETCFWTKAEKTFLWVALVCKEIWHVDGDKTETVRTKLKELPSGLKNLYALMIQKLALLPPDDQSLCRKILAVASMAERPLHWRELVVLADLPKDLHLEMVRNMISRCGSFVALRHEVVHFVHLSAREYLTAETNRNEDFLIYPSGKIRVHFELVSSSIRSLHKSLRRNPYGLRRYGILTDEIVIPTDDPLLPYMYSCIYWVFHLLKLNNQLRYEVGLTDTGAIHRFLKESFLYWLEALALKKQISHLVTSIRPLKDACVGSPAIEEFLQDAWRFLMYNHSIIRQAPLQIYCSALVFAPTDSTVRRQFEKDIPYFLGVEPSRPSNTLPRLAPRPPPPTQAPATITCHTGLIPKLPKPPSCPREAALQAWLDQATLDLFIALLDHPLKGDLFKSALVGFLAVLGVDTARQTFHNLYSYTSYLSGLAQQVVDTVVAVWERARARAAERATIQADKAANANPWLRITGWAWYLDSVHPQDLQRLVKAPAEAPPEGDARDFKDRAEQAVQVVWDTINQLARRSQRTVQCCSTGICVKAACTEAGQTLYQPLQAYLDKASI